MKSLKNSLNLCLIASALLLVSCGKKENKVNSASSTNPISQDNPAFGSTAGSTIVNQIQSIKTNVQCLNGYRLTNDVHFNVTGGSVSATKISGNWVSGFNSFNNGLVNKLWVGVSAFRDLIFVTQVTNGGSQVVGYNVTLSFCEMKSKDTNGSVSVNLPSVISNERELKNFATPYGIILDTNTYCGYGVVDLAQNTMITSMRNLSNPYSPPDAQIPTSYSKPTCNGQF